MRRTISAAVAVVAAITLAACSSDDTPAAKTSTSTASLNPAPAPTPAAADATVDLAWSHTGTFFDEPQVWYVARVKNPGTAPASVTLDARALDDTGTIVGSAQPALPAIPAGATLDYLGYLGYLGGGGALNTELTGTPAKIEVSPATVPAGGAQPMLKTSEVKLTKGDEDTYTDAPLSYNLSVRVTNSTKNTVNGFVTQQVVLYDADGNVVGGDTGSSDNVPDNLPAGMSYREEWTGIPALGTAVRAVYTVWPG